MGVQFTFTAHASGMPSSQHSGSKPDAPVMGVTRESVLTLSLDEYNALPQEEKQNAIDFLVRISKQSIPPTPRLASLAIADTKTARHKIKEFGIDTARASEDAHRNPGGGYATVGGQKNSIKASGDL